MGDAVPETTDSTHNHWPAVIQGGMGVAISDWHLARAVASAGGLGVVSGTALDQVMVRRLQDGDPGGHMRAAFAAFPVPEIAERAWSRYYIEGGKPPKQSYVKLPMQAQENSAELEQLCVLSNFAEVWLARQGHANPVGINYLEKIQIPHLPSLYGALLAGVSFVLMGAGIPLKIPGAIDALARHEPATYPLTIAGAQPGDDTLIRFDPSTIMGDGRPPLHRPHFLAIVASSTLALTLLRKANGKVNGFIIEGPTAGGHNAPPRGKLQLTDDGEPIYGDRDRVDLAPFREFGVPFWLAGGYGSPEGLRAAQAEGAAGVQVGTAFALCEDSGLRPDYRASLLAFVREAGTRVKTDPFASPTGFPFKVAQLPDTVSVDEVYAARPRICDLGYLREPYRTEEGRVGYRCASEPVSLYVSKGGDVKDTVGRKCICNALMATAGFPQVRAGKHIEAGIVTSGDALTEIARFLPEGADGYRAADVVRTLLGTGA